MKVIINGFLDDVYMSFLRSPIACCTPTSENGPGRTGAINSRSIIHEQPRLISQPIPIATHVPGEKEWLARSKEFTKRASSRGSFSVKRRLNAYNGFQSRRPQISAPTNFRHLDHAIPQRKDVFRPLQLSIYAPENQLSPIMPHFGTIDDMTCDPRDKELPAFPPAVMMHSRSDSAMSYRIPRKPIRSSTQASLDSHQTKHRPDSFETRELLASMERELPQVPPTARLRSTTEPSSYERVKSILQEKRELEQKLRDIEETIEERRSIYLSSRPTSRATSRARSAVTDHDPMPSPPMAPSFAERIATPNSERPQTAPLKTVYIPNRHKSFSEASSAFTTVAPEVPRSRDLELMPPPPLPLVLRAGVRPPLRKKKSFSRVSNWLFPDEQHSRSPSLDSITNDPKPVTSREGFYQCVDRSERPRASYESDGTISTLETETEIEQLSPPTTWSPNSTPGRDQIERGRGNVKIRQASVDEDLGKSLELTRVRTFGEKDGVAMSVLEVGASPYSHGRNSVGVAF